jgi:endonuclease YncB( thermonuclease family)
MSKNKNEKDILDDLNDQLKKEKEKLERAKAAEDVAKKVAEVRKQEEASKKKTTNILDSVKPKAGTIKRLGSALGALSPVDAIYKANEASFKEDAGTSKLNSFVSTLGKAYAKSIIDNLKTAGTGTDYTIGQKTGRDIVSKQMGAGKGAASTVAGLALDIATDPINVVGGPAFKAISKTLSFAGKQMTTLASKAPAVEKGIDTLKSQFNVFYEIEKLYKPSSVDKFKTAFSKAAETNNFDHLAKLGFDVSKYTKKSYKPELQKNIPKEFYKVLDEAFIPSTAKENILSTGLKKTSSVYKQIMAFSPRFQSRNALGGLTQGLTEMTQNSGNLWGLKNYYDAAKMLVTKGATNKPLYNNLKAHGVMSQTGMFDTLKNEGITKLPYMIANISESLNRTALVLNKTGVGKSVNEAIQISKDTFYTYNKAYKTKLEKAFMDVIDPFYSFNKGQVSYFPSALSRNAKKYNALTKVKEGTESEAERDNPLLTPEWWKDILSVDSIGNFGFQFEDFLRTATIDTKALWSKLQPILKSTGELLIDWNVYKDKKISTDTSAKGYEGLGKIGGAVVGYDPATRTMDPYVKYAIETALGPVLKPLAALFDKNTPLSQGLTSIKDYDQDPKKWQQQYAMDLKNKEANNFWKNLNDRFGFTFDTGTEKKGVPSIATAGSGGSDVKLYSKPSAEMMFNINTSMRASAKLAEALRMSGNLVEGSYKSMQQELGAERWYSKVTGEDPKAYKKREEAYINYQKKTLPRYINQPGYFSAWEFENIQPTMGMNKEQIAFNKLQENYNKMKAKLQSFQIAGYGDDKSAALEKRDQDRQEALKTVNAQYLGKDGKYTDPKKAKEELTKAYVGIERDFYTTISKIEGKSNKATASILKNWADATSNAYEKIEYNRQAAIKEYEDSDEYRSSVSNAEKIAAAKKAINAKYDKQRQDQIAEDAKATMESVKTMTEGNAKAIIAGLEAIYKRGGMTISDYYGKILDTHTKKAIEQAKAALKLIEASFQTTETGASANKGLSFDTPAISPYVKWAKDNRIGTDAEKGAVISINGKAIKVVDGDTFEFETEGGVNGSGKFNTRLYGFDAPETAKYDKNGTQINPDQAYGKKAAEALKKAIEGQVVTLKVVAIDTYGRPVSVVSKGNENINKSMLKGGYGEAYKEYLNNPEYKDAFLAAEQEAKASKSGVWSLKNYERPTDFRARWRKSMMEKYTTSTASSMDSTERLLAADNIKYDVEASPGKTVSAEALKKALAQIDALYAKFQKTKNVESFLADVNGLKLQDQGITFNMKTNPETSLNDVASDAKAFIGNVLTSLGQQDMTYDQAVNELKAYAEKMRELGASVQGANINKKQLQEGIDALNKVATGLEEKTFEVQTAIQTENIKVIESIKETKDFLSKSKLSLFSEMPTSDFGITSTSSGLKWGKIRRPGKQYRPEDYDVEAEQKKATQETAAAPYASQMKKILTEQPGSFETKDWMMQAGESSLEYMTRLETAVQNHKLNLENMEQQSQDKLKRIQETAAQWQMQNTKTVQDFEIAAYAKKVQSYADMTSTLSAAASNFYEASGKKSKEWFYIMKAAALAEAMVKGYQAIMNAFTAGTSSGKGVTGGFAEVAVATAFVASQIALITSQMFAGPGKAKGGPITGGSGTKDDVPIMAMGGEYVIRKSSTEKYGTAFLDALNRGLIPVSDLKFSVPHIPEPMHYQTHFAEGGQVPVSTSKTPITVELKNESGTPLQQKKSDVSFDGQQYVVSVWLDALNRNAYGLRDSLGR